MSSIFREKLKLTKFLSQYKKHKVNLRDLIAATGLVILLELDLNRWFSAHATLKFDEWTKRKIGHLFYTTSSMCIISNPMVNSNWSYSPKTLNSGQNLWFIFVSCDLEILWMTVQNNRAPPLYYLKLCASFQSHDGWFKIGVTVRKRSIRVEINDFLSRVTLKFNRWH